MIKRAIIEIGLNPNLDAQELAHRFARDDRVQIDGFLDDAAARILADNLRMRKDWRLLINQGGKLFELDRDAQAALTPDARVKLDDAVFAAARYDFQYRYESIRVPDGEAERSVLDDPLARLALFLSSRPVVHFLRQVTGQAGIEFADAQATAYGPGHFLTAHDDAVTGKNRLAAYVYNLTPGWRIDWGGMLLFHGADGNVEGGLTPGFNMLNLFTVPQPHSVSLVTPAAALRRYSITGWLRGRD